MPPDRAPNAGVLLDLDGTLVDSVYVHVVTWYQAFRSLDLTVPMAAIHAGIGMGSDRLVPWLVGHHPQASEISDEHAARFLDMADELVPTNGALALLEDLEAREVPFVISTSADGDERTALLEALGRQDLEVVGADDVVSSKPAPDLLLAARDRFDPVPEDLVMVGDAPWDAMAARRAGMDAVAVTCGGFPAETLRRAGASRVVADPAELVGTL